MFERIKNSGKPDALKTYASTYEGKSITDLATINEGRQLMELLQREAPNYRGGLGLPKATLLAIGGRGGPQAIYIGIDEMIDAGFSADKPIHLVLLISQGQQLETSINRMAGDGIPAHSNDVMLEVFDTCYDVATDRHGGLSRAFTTISNASRARSVAPAPVEDAPQESKEPAEPASKGKK